MLKRTAAAAAAFVFDIDGVITRGAVLDCAKSAFAKLVDESGSRLRVPVVFMTNGGGVQETQKAAELSSWLGVPIGEEQHTKQALAVTCQVRDMAQVVLSHTPLRTLLPSLHAQRSATLVCGRGDLKAIGQSVGLTNMITCDEIGSAISSITPFQKHSSSGPSLSALEAEGKLPVETIIAFTEPLNWGRDMQIIYDCITGGGHPCGIELHPGKTKLRYISSNPDVFWANEFPKSRFGQGAFTICLKSLVQETTGRALNVIQLGKPTHYPYIEASARLERLAETEITDIYMVGDNPESDIAGANSMQKIDSRWQSVLVRTGVFRREDENNQGHSANHIFDDVLAAVTALSN